MMEEEEEEEEEEDSRVMEVVWAMRDLCVVGKPLELDVTEHLRPHTVAVAHLAPPPSYQHNIK